GSMSYPSTARIECTLRKPPEVSEAPAYQAYQILHLCFTVAPIIAGLDKFTNFLANWSMYLAPAFARLAPTSIPNCMRMIGLVEVAAGLLVAFKPKIGAYVVAAWLCGIILNLLIIPAFFDIALRDLGLALSALALGRLAKTYDA